MINNPRYFYELFLKTRYLDEFTRGDLKKYAELIMLTTIDFKKVRFDKSIQKKIVGRYLTTSEERVDKIILHGKMFSFMALAFVEQQLNPIQEFDHSLRWPFLSNSNKALLLKYLLNLKNDSYNTDTFKKVLNSELDFEMIPERYLKLTTKELVNYIKNYDSDFESEKQLSMGE